MPRVVHSGQGEALVPLEEAGGLQHRTVGVAKGMGLETGQLACCLRAAHSCSGTPARRRLQKLSCEQGVMRARARTSPLPFLPDQARKGPSWGRPSPSTHCRVPRVGITASVSPLYTSTRTAAGTCGWAWRELSQGGEGPSRQPHSTCVPGQPAAMRGHEGTRRRRHTQPDTGSQAQAASLPGTHSSWPAAGRRAPWMPPATAGCTPRWRRRR